MRSTWTTRRTRSTPMNSWWPNVSATDPFQSALLSSLLGGQPGGAGGVDLQSLLAAQGGAGQGAPLDLASLVAARAADAGPGDERMALVQRWMEQRQAAPPASVADEAPSAADLELQRLDEVRDARERRREERAAAGELQTLLQTLYAEVAALRARNDAVAAALGACHLCFGDDPVCSECAGRGTPGSLLPEAIAFRQYVVPAVRRIRAAPARDAPARPAPPRADRYARPVNDPPPTSAYHPTPGALP